MRGSRGGRTALWTVSWPCLRLCPGYFKCVVVYVRHKFRRLTGTSTEAELLVELWTCRMILLQSTPDTLNGVRGFYRRVGGLPEKVALYFCCEGRSVLLCMEGVFRISINCYDAAWPGQLELEVGIMRHRIESSECGSSEQCVITAAKSDDVKD